MTLPGVRERLGRTSVGDFGGGSGTVVVVAIVVVVGTIVVVGGAAVVVSAVVVAGGGGGGGADVVVGGGAPGVKSAVNVAGTVLPEDEALSILSDIEKFPSWRPLPDPSSKYAPFREVLNAMENAVPFGVPGPHDPLSPRPEPKPPAACPSIVIEYWTFTDTWPVTASEPPSTEADIEYTELFTVADP